MEQKLPEGFRIEEGRDEFSAFARLFTPNGKCYEFMDRKTAEDAARFGPEFLETLMEGCE